MKQKIESSPGILPHQVNLDYRTEEEVRADIKRKNYKDLNVKEIELLARDTAENREDDNPRYGH